MKEEEEKEWVIARRQYRKEVDGVEQLITEEYLDTAATRKRAKLDNILKVVGVLSIFIPLIILAWQNSDSAKQKINNDLSALVVNVAFEIESIKNSAINSKEFSTSWDNLQYRYPPQLDLFKFDDITTKYGSISADCKNERDLKDIIFQMNDLQNSFAQILKEVKVNNPQKNDGENFIGPFSMIIVSTSKKDLLQKISTWKDTFQSVLEADRSETYKDFAFLRYQGIKDQFLAHTEDSVRRALTSLVYIDDYLANLNYYLQNNDTGIFEIYYRKLNVEQNSPASIVSRSLNSVSVIQNKVDSLLTGERVGFEKLVEDHIR